MNINELILEALISLEELLEATNLWSNPTRKPNGIGTVFNDPNKMFIPKVNLQPQIQPQVREKPVYIPNSTPVNLSSPVPTRITPTQLAGSRIRSDSNLAQQYGSQQSNLFSNRNANQLGGVTVPRPQTPQMYASKVGARGMTRI